MADNLNGSTCPNCGREMRYSWLKNYLVQGTGKEGTKGLYCCSQWCADQIKKVIDRGSVIFKCYACSKWVKRPQSLLKNVHRPTCSIRCANTVRRRLAMAKKVRLLEAKLNRESCDNH